MGGAARHHLIGRGQTEHADVIVIGSGGGGDSGAWALAPTGATVLLLERGNRLPREIGN